MEHLCDFDEAFPRLAMTLREEYPRDVEQSSDEGHGDYTDKDDNDDFDGDGCDRGSDDDGDVPMKVSVRMEKAGEMFFAEVPVEHALHVCSNFFTSFDFTAQLIQSFNASISL